jgi:hypothetical protein
MTTHIIKNISIRNWMGVQTLTPEDMGVTYSACPRWTFNNLYTAPEGCCFIKVVDGKFVIPATEFFGWVSSQETLSIPKGFEMKIFYDGESGKADFNHVCKYYIVNIAQLEQVFGDQLALIYADRHNQYNELLEFERKQEEYWKSTAAAAKSAMDDYFKNR